MNIVDVHPMQVEVVTQDTKRHILYAMNDVVIGGNILDYFAFDVQGETFTKNVVGTGMIFSTALGSSGYWLGNG